MSSVAASARRPPNSSPGSYFERAELPLTSLLFLLPLMAVYEVGIRFSGERIIAFDLMHDFFRFFGATGQFLPCMAVVGILLTWHIARNDPWQLHGRTAFAMAIESAALSFPVIVLSMLVARFVPMAADHRPSGISLITPLGAGIYEELVFRLIGFTVLNLVLVDLLHFPKALGVLLIVLISAFLFSAYHYLGWEPFQWRTFVFRTVAGLYFGVIFLLRGFGVTAGSHAAYDLVVAGLIAAHRG